MASYELARSPVESLFVEKHTAAIPQAWLVVAIGSVFVFGLWSHWAARIDLVRGLDWLVDSVPWFSLIAIGLSGRFAGQLPRLVSRRHLHCLAHRDFLVLCEPSHAVVESQSGVPTFLGVGSIGNGGGLLGGQLAVHLGTREMLWTLIPLLGVVWLGCRVLQSPEMTGTVLRKRRTVPVFVTGFGCSPATCVVVSFAVDWSHASRHQLD